MAEAMELGMDMFEAIDTAASVATTEGLGEPIEETPAETPEVTPEVVETTEVEAETSTDDLAASLAELTHAQVVMTPAGKGLTAELHREREKRRKLEEQLSALQANPAEEVEVDAPGEVLDADDDDDADVFTNKDVDKRIAKYLKPLQDQFARTDKVDRTQVMESGLAALEAQQPGVKVRSIVNKVMADLKKSDPDQLALLVSKPNPVDALWRYGQAFMPDVQQTVAKASKTKADVAAERLAKGQSPETGGEPADISDLIADLNAP